MGRITSTASLSSAGLPQVLALGFIRVEVLERNQEIAYDGGVATALAAPPAIARPWLNRPAEPNPSLPKRAVSFSFRQRYKRRLEKTMREKEPQFTVTDRRKFTAEGELREGEAKPAKALLLPAAPPSRLTPGRPARRNRLARPGGASGIG